MQNNGSKFSQIGFQMFFTIAAGTALGFWIDKKLDSKPLATISLLFVSLFLAMYGVYKQLPKQ